MSDTALVAIIVGFATVVVTLLGSVWASKRWGLPGLARDLGAQREEYIAALERNNKRLEAENRTLTTMNRRLVADNRDYRAKLAVAYGDIAELYERCGESVPAHVLATRTELESEVSE